MGHITPSFTLGIEEEYLLVDQETMDLAEPPPEMMEACKAELSGQVSPEFLQCQVEVGTRVSKTIEEAGSDLRRLREAVARIAGKFGMRPISVSSHPSACWQDQSVTDHDRYRELERDIAGVARRLLTCGMHVHVGVEDNELRIDLMNQFAYFLPHLLALSTSSPFWRGIDTGLACYRLTVFDSLPRTGLPPYFSSYNEYESDVSVIIDSGLIDDATKIWWDVRPSGKFPTLESRICDALPKLGDTLSIAALTQCLMRMLFRLKTKNQSWRIYDRFQVGENRWRAQRYGTSEGLIDFGIGKVTPFRDLLDELIEHVMEDAEFLGCAKWIERTREILENGTSATRQKKVYDDSLKGGASQEEALRQVTRSLVEEFSQDL